MDKTQRWSFATDKFGIRDIARGKTLTVISFYFVRLRSISSGL